MKNICILLILSLSLQYVAPIQLLSSDQKTKRIALVDFRNLTGDVSLDRYTKSIPDQIQTILASHSELRMVERGQLESALQELQLSMVGIVNDQTAVRLGKVLNANAIITGSYYQEGQQLQITARVIDVETSEVITGVIKRCQSQDEIFKTVDRLADELFDQLKKNQWLDVDSQEKVSESRKFGRKWLLVGCIGLTLVITGVIVLLSGNGDTSGESDSGLPDPPVRPD